MVDVPFILAGVKVMRVCDSVAKDAVCPLLDLLYPLPLELDPVLVDVSRSSRLPKIRSERLAATTFTRSSTSPSLGRRPDSVIS